jgi:Rrf2 family protein
MLTLTRKTDYALIALTHLSQNKESCTSAREIATLYGLPLPLLMNVLKLLGQQGLAKSSRGPKGGYQLARSPNEITLHDIILAVEGPIQLVQCIGHDVSHLEDAEGGDCLDDDLAALSDDVEVSGGALHSSEACGRTNGRSAHASTALESTRPEVNQGETNGASGCELMCTCPVRHPIHRIQSKLVEFVRSVTLADVAEGNGCCQPEDSNQAMTS